MFGVRGFSFVLFLGVFGGCVPGMDVPITALDTVQVDVGADVIPDQESDVVDSGAPDVTPNDPGTPPEDIHDVGLPDEAEIAQEVSSDLGSDPGDGSDWSAADGGDAGIADVGADLQHDQSPIPCSPPLVVSMTELFALPYALVTFQVSGGSGTYSFTKMGDDVEGSLNEFAGTYLTGPTLGTVTIEVGDEQCGDVIAVSVHVVEAMRALPSVIALAPGETMQAVVEFGSGQYGFSFLLSGSGGIIDDSGLYTAGVEEGFDVIQVKDVLTGQVETISVDVRANVSFRAMPEQLFLPLGSSFVISTIDGSEGVSVQTAPDGLQVDGTKLTALEEGVFEVVLLDPYSQKTTVQRVVSGPSHHFVPNRRGYGTAVADVETPGDINGDGYPDVVMGLREASINAVLSGGIFVYAGGPEGLLPDPVRVIGGASRDDRAGESIRTKDVNSDGLVDLLIGTYLGDTNSSNSGFVDLYLGTPGGFFEDEPAQRFTGEFGSDYTGYRVDACDFNGDGWSDIVISRWAGEDRNADPVENTQGAIDIYLGSATGFSAQPSMKVHGMGPDSDSGTWAPQANLRLGWGMVAGYLDGDEYCDLAVAAYYPERGSTSYAGSVLIYRGVGPTGFSYGGLEAEPTLAYRPDWDSNKATFLGMYLHTGDVTGDGIDELLISESHFSNDDGTASSAGGYRGGAAYLRLGGPFPENPEAVWRSPMELDWMFFGDVNQGFEGRDGALADVTGDGLKDIVISSLRGTDVGSTANAGSVRVFPGVQDALPANTPTQAYVGTGGWDYFGVGVGVIGDVEGDGYEDLFVFASLQDSLGRDVGRPYYISGAPDSAYETLDMPGLANGQWFGHSVACIPDVNGDSYPELAVGAPRASDPAKGLDVGQVHLYHGTATGFETEPYDTLKSFPGYTASDWSGWRVEGTGDFNGDEIPDLVVMARYEDRFVTFPSGFVDQCGWGLTSNQSNTGGVYVFLGTADGNIDYRPSFYFGGPLASAMAWYLDFGGDANGDGKSDILIGTYTLDRSATATSDAMNDVGVVWLVQGREVTHPGSVEVICSHDAEFKGLNTSDNLSRVAFLGDINQDGCDEFAVGAINEDHGSSNQGAVRVFMGWRDPGSQWVVGNENCPTQIEYATMVPSDLGAQSGYDLDGGLDVEGDGIPDLLVGGPGHRVDNVATGAAWLIPGAYIANLPRDIWEDGVMPSTLSPFAPSGSLVRLRVEGPHNGSQFGYSVSLVPGIGPYGTAGIAVGAPSSSDSGVDLSGSVRVHIYDPADGGLTLEPIALMGGETNRPGGRISEALDACAHPNGAVMGMGGYWGSGVGIDTGSAYSWLIEFPWSE